ncbi:MULTISPECIES: hypothetical protein [unclassified Moraxella]|uniref:hypothetical protein n=1 Tax=unclassified Moraxella TaxID=2685852 RepID=UPI003AF5C603
MDFMSVSFASILSMLAMTEGLGGANAEPEQVAKISTYTLPPIAGQWQLDLAEAKAGCQERYNFGRDQLFLGSSGEELTYGKYLYSVVSEGLPALAIQTKYDNNAEDCSGKKIDQAGDILVAYVKQTGNTMQWCADGEGKKCDMTLHRVLP